MDREERRKLIVDFISVHQGCNTEKACKGVESYISRVTFFKTLNELKEDKIIRVEEKTKPNARDNKLFIDDTNLLVKVPKELEAFEKVFLNLLKKAESKTSRKDKKSPDSRSSLLVDLLIIYHHVVGVYLTHSILTWSQQIPEKEVLTRLYSLVFSKLTEIQLKLAEIYRVSGGIPPLDYVAFGDLFNPLLGEFIQRSFLLTFEKIHSIRETCENYELLKEVDPVIDVAWRIGFDLYLFTQMSQIKILPKDFSKLKDWRMALVESSRR